ncbi:GNAT family N-acetyltransferase [Lysinibacillus sp. CD3-6]|uniref:GNAT family N-acetyltransferase n=1 Tax=Lysinibacillus sp. CD3-6 TaxID=2892541 RepID=UPI001169CDA6|nr:GNAT family N-acetyltransferase [Lysinibacillus sp. CD3-6]UED79544.1 GNAT family N-acetyltransferase [Lysinibacillus sp. CD3-6]
MLEYKLVTTINELETYKDTWSEILEREKNDNPFIEYEWISTWWMIVGHEENVEIYIVEHNGEAIAFFPFVHTSRFGGIHQFSFLGQGIASYMEVVAEKRWKEQAVHYLLKELISKFTRVLFVLHGLLESKDTSPILEKYTLAHQLPYSVFRIVTPYIDFKSIELPDFLKKHKRRFKSIDRREKRLKELGTITYQKAHAGNLDNMFQLFERRWQKKMDTSGFTAQRTKAFFEQLAKQQNGALSLKVHSLQFENTWIGFTLDICCRGRNFCHAMGHEPDFNMFGPGRLIEKENMLKAHSMNVRLYDFGIGYEPYKFDWYTHLDFTRKFIMSTAGVRERALRTVMVLQESLLALVKTNRRIVEWKRNTLGELRYLFTKADRNEWLSMLKCKVFNGQKFTIYYLEQKLGQYQSNFQEINIQSVLENDQRTELLAHYFKGYKLYGQKQDISFLRHDQFIHEEADGFKQELPPNTTYIKNYELPKLQMIVDEVQREGLAICTSANWFEWRKRKTLTALGFRKVERVLITQLFKWKKVHRHEKKWVKFFLKHGQQTEQRWHLALLSFLI